MAHTSWPWWSSLWLVLPLFGCTSEGETKPPTEPPPSGSCEPGEYQTEGGGCCPAGTTALDDGSCQPAGIAAEFCHEGFISDGEQGCEAVLPVESCGVGEMAVPGETSCRAVAPCGSGAWGDIPVEPDTQHVDGSYVAGDSDGSSAKPWTTIQEGIDKAGQGAIVAVAAGSYGEDLYITGKPVRLWGRCPAMVEVVGTGAEFGAVSVHDGAAQSQIRALAITGAGPAVVVSGSTDVLLDSLWIHDSTHVGVDVESVYGPTSVLLQHSLVERSQLVGVLVVGAELTMERSVLRTTLQATSGSYAGQFGFGASVEDDAVNGADGSLTIRGSLVEQNVGVGVYAVGGSVVLESTVLRDTLVGTQGAHGRGLVLEENDSSGRRGDGVVSGCVFTYNREHGLAFSAGSLTMTATVVRDTAPDPQGFFGRGINVQASATTATPATAAISHCLIDGNRDAGLFVSGSDVTVEGTVVRRTTPDITSSYGRGITTRPFPETGRRSALWLTTSVIAENTDVGVFVGGSDATIDRTAVLDTLALPDGTVGDGITLISRLDSFAAVQLIDSQVARTARAGLSNFGSTLTLQRVHVDCCPIALNGEQDYPYLATLVSLPFTFQDWEGNVCGCGPDQAACQVLSSGLAPPLPPL